MQFGFILSLVFATIVAIFALKNADKVLIDFIFNKIYISQALVIFLSAILGAVIVAILGSIKVLKLKKQTKELNKTNEFLKNENDNFKILIAERENDIMGVNVEEKNDEDLS